MSDIEPPVVAGAVAVPLRNKKGEVRAWTLVDEADAEWAMSRRWCLNRGGYARNVNVLLHRALLCVADRKLEVDHINRDKLDNRRANLRICTRSQNAQNRGGYSNGLPRGVTFDTWSGRYKAQVTLNYRNHYLGRHDTIEEAAEAARAFRAEHMPYARD